MLRGPRATATMPDCTISRTPNGSSTRSSAASLSTLPVASIVTASGDTSTTLARNSWTVSSTAERVWTSARTLISISSRCTDAWGSSSTTLITSISLFSCLVTCSRGSSSTSTTTVIREMSECSVGPTARESMLKPRRENRPAMRARTPGLSSTRTDRVCLDTGSLLAVPRGAHAPRELDLVVGQARGDHGPPHRVAVDHEVDDDGPVVHRHGGLDGGVQVLRALAPQADAAVGVGHLDEVRDPPGRAGVQVGVAVALAVEQRLPLPHHAEAGVVDHRDLDRDLVDDAGRELLVGHLEAAVAVDGPDRPVGQPRLGAHRRGHGVPHGAQTAGVDPGVRLLVADELRGPHLVLPDAGGEDRVRPADLPQPGDDLLRRQRPVLGLVVPERVRAPPVVDLGPPGRVVAAASGLALRLQR